MLAQVVVQDNRVIEVIVDMGKPLLLRKDIPMLGNPNELVINEIFPLPQQSLLVTALFWAIPIP